MNADKNGIGVSISPVSDHGPEFSYVDELLGEALDQQFSITIEANKAIRRLLGAASRLSGLDRKSALHLMYWCYPGIDAEDMAIEFGYDSIESMEATIEPWEDELCPMCNGTRTYTKRWQMAAGYCKCGCHERKA